MEKMLVVSAKENIVIKLLKWVRRFFSIKSKAKWEEMDAESIAQIVAPKEIIIPTEKKVPVDTNSLEYLYQLSEDELEKLELSYDEKIEEAKKELIRLEEILQTYKKSIKNFQENV